MSSIDYRLFLKSDKPEEKILAILANFEKDKPVTAITNILKEVKTTAKSSFAESKYFRQLRVLVQLRNLEKQFNNAMESITEFFKEEKDPLFQRGEAKGREEGKFTFVKNLLLNTDFDLTKIASLAGASVSFVKKVKKELKKEAMV